NCLAERGGSCCASIRDIENRYSPLANVAKDPLARKCDRLEGASAVQRLDIVDREAGISKRLKRGFGSQLLERPFRITAKGDHIDPDDHGLAHATASTGRNTWE